MKGKIKILSLLMALAVVSSMFAACKSEAPETTPSGDTPPPASTDADKDADKPKEVVEISYYAWGDEPADKAAVVDALNKKSEADIGVKVNWKFQTGDDKSLRTALASGDKDIDLVFACGWFADYIGSAQANYFKDLTDLLPTAAPALYKEFPDELWQGVKVGGKVYGIPVWKDVAAQQFWMAREEVIVKADAMNEFKAAGLKVSSLTPLLEKVKAWHDADPAANAYAEGTTAPFTFNRAGLNGHNNMWDELQADLRIGVKFKEGNTTVQSYYTDADYIDDMKALKDWADRGLSNGKVAQQVEQEPKLCNVSTAQGWEGAQFSAWGGPVKGYSTLIQPKTQPILTSGTVQGGINCVGANSEKAEAALKFTEYVNTNADYRNMMSYGIEGTNWRKATEEDVKKFYTEGKSTEEEITANIARDTGKVALRLTGDGWAPGGFSLGSWKYLLPELGCVPEMYQNICAMATTATGSPLLGFVPTTEKVKNQITACTSLIQEVMQPLQCGAVKDVDATIADLLKKLEKQGYNDIIKEYQAQVDAFIASK